MFGIFINGVELADSDLAAAIGEWIAIAESFHFSRFAIENAQNTAANIRPGIDFPGIENDFGRAVIIDIRHHGRRHDVEVFGEFIFSRDKISVAPIP